MKARNSNKLWIECIANRKEETLSSFINPMLSKWMFQDCIVYTDALKSYKFLEVEHSHYVINKEKDGFSRKYVTYWGKGINVNVNHIESTWMRLRSLFKTRKTYCSQHKVQLHIAEFMYNHYKLEWFDLIRY